MLQQLIHVITKRPSSETGGKLSVSYGNYDTKTVSGYFTTGIAEGVAIARDMFDLVKRDVQGVQVSAPFGKVEVALEVFR